MDGATLAILTNRFDGVVRAMANTLVRTGRSGVLNTCHDFSCCVLTDDDELLAMAESIPAHVMSGPDLMAKSMKEFHPDLRRGDAYLHNSPYHGNSHPADHSILVPVIDAKGSHRFTVLVKAHQADCGNSIPTTYHASARDVYEEGALIFPCVKVQSEYEDCQDIIRMCRLRIRVPNQWWGDYLALVGAARIGEQRVLELADEFGWDMLERYSEAWFGYSERKMIEAIGLLPTGKVRGTSKHDPFPGVPDGLEVNVSVEVDSEKGKIEVDLRDNPGCLPSGLNLSEATSRTAAMIGVFNTFDGSVPTNAGSFRRMSVLLRENCCVGIPRHPASCSLATTDLFDRLTNAVLVAIAELGDGIGMAEVGVGQPPVFGVISGTDPRRGNSPFVNQVFFPAQTGGAATNREDGWLTNTNAGTAGMLWRESVELAESRHPIHVYRQTILRDTEAAGKFRGAPGGLIEYGPVNTGLTIYYTSDGSVYPPRGVRGGYGSRSVEQYKRDADGEIHSLPNSGSVELEASERVISISCGGGGYGRPDQRDYDRVAEDVSEEWISAERAIDVYKVVIDDQGNVDREASDRLRGLLNE